MKMIVTASDIVTIQALAARLLKLTPRDANQVALVGFMAGALYALERAVELGFHDGRMKLDLAIERAEQRQTLKALELATVPGNPWLAGFYFDSAILRLSALNERIDMYLGTKHNIAAQIRRLVNKIKHEVDADIGSGWNIKLSDVLTSTKDLCGLLESAIA